MVKAVLPTGRAQTRLLQELVKAFPVLRRVDVHKVGAQQGIAIVTHRLGQFDRRLSAKLHHNPLGCSTSRTFQTSSEVRGSKYRVSAVS